MYFQWAGNAHYQHDHTYDTRVGRERPTGVLISTYPDHEGNKLGSISGTRAISTTSSRELSSRVFFPQSQGAEGNSRHSDRNISLFPSWLG